ncbi:Right handed beta helix region [uncultured archaeon]|nr:Right handed beta helix region [uncultured archaeon]
MVSCNFYRGKRLRTEVGITILLIILMVSSADAAVLEVNSNHGLRIQSIVYPTIQGAIDGANDGDLIIVTAGTYYENLTISNKINLTITGAGIGSTIIQPNVLKTTGLGHKYDADMHVALFVNLSTNLTIQGITISGNGLNPNAVIFWNAATGEIKNSRITDTSTLTGLQTGQGIAIDASSGQISSLNLTNIQVDGFNKNGIDAVDGNGGTSPGTITVNINGGSITGVGQTTTIAQNGILFWNNGTGTVGGSINGVSISNLNYTPTNNEATGILGYSGGPDSISNSVFSNVESYIYASSNIDASIGNTFDGVAATSATDAQLFAIEDMIYHKLDDAALGLVKIKPNNVYVTPASGSLQRGIDAVPAGGVVNVAPGTYTEPSIIGPQISINKDLSIVGADKTTTIIKPSADTGAGITTNDVNGWFLVDPGVTFNLSNVTLDGDGKNISQAIRSHASGTIQNNIIKNMGYNPSTAYKGMGIVTFDANMIISNNSLSNIGRIGIYVGSGVTNSVISGNTYTGKGNGNWLDYGIEVGRGGNATITDNTVCNCTGIATVDGSTSAGILVTTYYNPGTSATITGNEICNNSVGIAVGYNDADASTVIAHYNNFTGNGEGVNSTNATVDATLNWWGADSGPGHVGPGSGDNVSTNVLYDPWLPIDETPPASVTDLVNVSYATNYINWTWTDPEDLDFTKVLIYLDGVPQGEVIKGDRHYNATVSPGTYTIGTKTVDLRGNINATMKTHTATTILPLVRFINGTVFESPDPLHGIRGVTVTIGSQTNTTNATGFYSFAVPDGSYSLTARLEPGYYTNSSVTVSTALRAVTVQNIELEIKPTGNISGTVSG